jgi:hypothetical protein
MERPSEHVEHVEHQQHAAASPFDRRVAMTIAIVAALLAGVTMLSHRAHNETILHQNKATDNWNYYQAKNQLDRIYQSEEFLLESFKKDAQDEDGVKKAKKWLAKEREKYSKEKLPELKKKAEASEGESHKYHDRAAWFDLGELGLELGLILCSIAILTKRTAFWYSGIAAALIGLAVALSGFIPRHHAEEESNVPALLAPPPDSCGGSGRVA